MPLFRSPSAALFLFAVLAAGTWSVLTIRFETELLPVLPAHLSSVRGLEEFTRLAAGDQEIYAVSDPALSPAAREQLLAQARATFSALPGVAAVSTPQEKIDENAGTFAAWLLLNSPPEVFQSTLQKLHETSVRERLGSIPAKLTGAVDPAEIVQLQLDPLGLLPDSESPVATAPESSSFLVITPAQSSANTADDAALVASLRDALRSGLSPEESNHVLLTGRPVFNADISRQMRRDMILMVAAATSLLLGAFYLFYRTLRPLGWIILLQLFALLTGLIAARVFYGGLNVISIGFASILLGVGMDYSILVYHHFGSPHRDDSRVWHTLRRAIWFSALVTAAAFYFLALTSFPALQHLGVLVGTGLLSSALVATWHLRLILTARPPQAPPVLFHASNRAAETVLRHRGLILGFGFALLAGIFWLRPWVAESGFYQANLDKLRPVGSDAYTAQEWLQQLDPAASDAIYVLRAPDHDSIRRAAPALAHAVAPGIKEEAAWKIPSESARAINLAAWPRGTATRLSASFANAGFGEEWSKPTLHMAYAIEAAAEGHEDAFSAIAPLLRTTAGHDQAGAYAILRIPGAAENPVPVGGWSMIDQTVEVLPVSWVSLTSEITAIAQQDFIRLGLAMLAAIVVLCALAQRSWRMVGLNFLALTLAAGLWLWLLRSTGTALTPLSLISLPLLVGLVVDYSLHVLMALQNQRGDLRKTYDHLAAPILLTGISACIGFGAPMLTRQPSLQNFGLVMDLGIIAAVAAGLIFLPPFYLIGQNRDYRERKFYRALYQKRGFEWILLGWRLLGERGAWIVSRSLGLLYALTHPATVHAVRDNLSLLNPRKANLRSACRLFMNQAENFSTYGRLSTRPTSDVVNMMGFRQGFEHLQRARERGKGCLLVTGHLGFFELGGLIMAQLGFPMTALTLPEPTTALTEWRADFRARWGVKTIVVGNDSFSVLDIVRSLQSGAFIASLADRPYDGNSVPVDLPHGRIPFSTGPVLLALLAGCPIVPVGITRQPDGKYHIEARTYIEPAWLPEGREETLRHYTREVAAALTPLFAAYPEQWYHFAPLRCE